MNLEKIAGLGILLLLLLVLLVAHLPQPVSADLPRNYQSDDIDLPGNPTNTSDFAKYYDYVFVNISDVVEEQNRRFVQSFPSTDEWESAVPSGVYTHSSGVIKDAYVKLIPVKGLVKVDGGFAADKRVTVGYLLDYRVQLPPDKTGRYPKHYYYLESTSKKITISSKSTKKGGGSRGVVEIDVGNDIRATATIKAVVKEKIVEKHRSCHEVCHEENNETVCHTSCHTYLITYYKHHTYTLTVKDRIGVVSPEPSRLYTLVKGKPVEYCILPGDTVTYIASDGRIVLSGLRYFTTYRTIKAADIYRTAGKSSYAGSEHLSLDEPAYLIAATPSYNILPLSSWVEDVKIQNATASVPNFKSETGFFDVKLICLRVNATNITLLDFFGNPVNAVKQSKVLVKPKVDVTMKSEPRGDYTAYVIKMQISYDGRRYSGPVHVSFRAKSFAVNATDGSVSFSVNGSGTVNYVIPSNLPRDWYSASNEVFMDTYHGSFYVGKMQPYLLPFYEFAMLAAAATPFALLYYVLKWLLRKEEEEYI